MWSRNIYIYSYLQIYRSDINNPTSRQDRVQVCTSGEKTKGFSSGGPHSCDTPAEAGDGKMMMVMMICHPSHNSPPLSLIYYPSLPSRQALPITHLLSQTHLNIPLPITHSSQDLMQLLTCTHPSLPLTSTTAPLTHIHPPMLIVLCT